jgi:hypothetical protein
MRHIATSFVVSILVCVNAVYVSAKTPTQKPPDTVAAAPNDPNIIDTLREAYFVNGSVDEAVVTEQKALALAPQRDDSLKQMEKFRKAKRQLRK